tara:strand:+ start:1787 stop:2458 length:672 start_codon:yes stop_codon:yes gene_type:complete
MTVADFSKQIKEGTKASHSMAENTGFVKNFLRGVISEENYRQLIADFYFVYRALEEVVEKHKDNPYVKPIAFNELKRLPNIEMDCRYFWGPTWRDLVSPTEACQNYVNRIREVEPELLAGHHYTRYLGDLSGGQILRNIAQKAMGLEDQGLKFYDFDAIPDKKEFKTKYRAALDSLPISVSEADALIAEANLAFKLNMYMFDEIQGSSVGGFLKMVWGFIRSL